MSIASTNFRFYFITGNVVIAIISLKLLISVLESKTKSFGFYRISSSWNFLFCSGIFFNLNC